MCEKGMSFWKSVFLWFGIEFHLFIIRELVFIFRVTEIMVKITVSFYKNYFSDN